MKNKILLFACISILTYSHISPLTAQTLKPQVIASAGGYQSNATASLSFTIGEPNTQTLTSANYRLTQGFQQPYKMTLNLRAFLQGYYTNGGMMENVLYNQGITALPGTQCDTISIQLRQPLPPFAVVSETKQIIQTNGLVTYTGSGTIGQSYYIIIKHRNTIETWSANPVTLTENTSYDFTTAPNKAFGNNMTEMEANKWALFSGDVNQDENTDLLDLSILETDINDFQFGYFATDINGDGNADLLDNPLLEANTNNFIFSVHP